MGYTNLLSIIGNRQLSKTGHLTLVIKYTDNWKGIESIPR